MPDNPIGDRPAAPVDRVLLVRFVAGEVTPAEAAAVERWLAEDGARRAELDELRRLWVRTGALPSEARVDALWLELRGRMHQSPAATGGNDSAEHRANADPRRALELVRPPSPSRRFGRRWLVATAAAAGIGAATVGLSWRGERRPSAPAASVERVYSTARGQRSVVDLADGSRVELGVDSRVRVRLHDGGRREVYLDGEAVFEVVHDERRPFFVYARNAVTEDLGTRFGVRAYRGDDAVQVVVAEGTVALRPAPDSAPRGARDADLVLDPGDLGELDAAGAMRRRRVDPESYLAWTTGRLVFRDATVREVAARLERWFDVEVVLADSAAAGRRVTLSLDGPSLREALDAIVVPLGWYYDVGGRRVVLRSS